VAADEQADEAAMLSIADEIELEQLIELCRE
jgi:hypothetical protein